MFEIKTSLNAFQSLISTHMTSTLFCHSWFLFPGPLSHRGRFKRPGAAKVKNLCVWTYCVIKGDCSLIKVLSLFLHLSSPLAVSRWAGSKHRWAGNVSSACYSWWWSWWSATSCAGCRTASWPCWPPSGRRAWSRPRRASSPRSWQRRARSSTQSSMSSWINRWEGEGGSEGCSWGQCLLSFAVTKQWAEVISPTEASQLDCFQGALILMEMSHCFIFLSDGIQVPSWHWTI